MLGSKTPFFIYLTGEQFQTIAVKSCFRSANAYQKQEKSHRGPTGEKKMIKIIVFLINEG